MIQNIRQVRDRINAEFIRLGVLGDSIVNVNGLRAKCDLTMVSIHTYGSGPIAAWAKEPEAVIEALQKCNPFDWGGKPSFPIEQVWLQIESTKVSFYALTAEDILGWDI